MVLVHYLNQNRGLTNVFRSRLRNANQVSQSDERMNMNTDTLLSRLQNVRSAGAGRWVARCSAHDDKSPSLSIRDTGDRVLIHCFSGCNPSDVIAAVGMDWKDLYPDRWDAAAARPNEGATAYARRTLSSTNLLEFEKMVIKIGNDDIRAGKHMSIEDRARYQLAMDRIAATGTSS
jgi:DNA primase